MKYKSKERKRKDYTIVDVPFFSKFKAQKKASYLHHTATTIYLCCVPALEDSTGAGCVGLAAAKIQSFINIPTIF